MPSCLCGRPILGGLAAIATEELVNSHRIQLDYRLESSDYPQINKGNIYVKIEAALCSDCLMEKGYFL